MHRTLTEKAIKMQFIIILILSLSKWKTSRSVMKLNLFSVFKDCQAGRIKTAHQKTPQNQLIRMQSFNMSPMVLSGMV